VEYFLNRFEPSLNRVSALCWPGHVSAPTAALPRLLLPSRTPPLTTEPRCRPDPPVSRSRAESPRPAALPCHAATMPAARAAPCRTRGPLSLPHSCPPCGADPGPPCPSLFLSAAPLSRHKKTPTTILFPFSPYSFSPMLKHVAAFPARPTTGPPASGVRAIAPLPNF
jgi:hypothetical protein